jgi:hypothetical protein
MFAAPVVFVIGRLRRNPAPDLALKTVALLLDMANMKQARIAGLLKHSGNHAAGLAAPISPMPVMAMPAVMPMPAMMIVVMPAHFGGRLLGVLLHGGCRTRIAQ